MNQWLVQAVPVVMAALMDAVIVVASTLLVIGDMMGKYMYWDVRLSCVSYIPGSRSRTTTLKCLTVVSCHDGYGV